MSESKVFMFDDTDPIMQQAYQNARANFRYFWREMSWERRRIIPALDLACIKAPFSDGDQVKRSRDTPEVEHMWISEIDFDGQFVTGVLLNSPNWLTTVKAGDPARIPLDSINDWMYAISGEVFGAYTVNLMRSRMDPTERKQHDDAWGLTFGDPKKIRVAPEPKKGGGFLKSWFGQKQADLDEHPMSEAMAPELKKQLAKNPSMLEAKDDKGWTMLHQEAAAGSLPTVNVLLEAGANLNVVTNQGFTPLQLAKSLGWDKVAAMLVGNGAK
jgi:uncharacterized protein